MFEIVRHHRTKWDASAGAEQPITLVPINRGPLAGKKIFTVGSCFALEIRHELAALGYDTFPKYFEIEFDPTKAMVGKLPERDNINHYSIASVLQEIENIAAPKPIFSREFFYDLSLQDTVTRQLKRFVKSIVSSNQGRFDAKWQDPFRKQVYATELNLLEALSNEISEKIREGARNADLFVITLGMTEVWADRKSGLVVCNSYGARVDEHLCEFVDLSVGDVVRMAGDAIRRIRQLSPRADVVLTVSPVPLQRTAKSESVVTANSLSKAKQRVAAAEVCSQFENVFYFPSFELSRDADFYVQDGRHVARAKVSHIVECFLRWYQGG
ncbi:MAG: GSCFA domain-containing protein [Xanthobacteraceae bacterium]